MIVIQDWNTEQMTEAIALAILNASREEADDVPHPATTDGDIDLAVRAASAALTFLESKRDAQRASTVTLEDIEAEGAAELRAASAAGDLGDLSIERFLHWMRPSRTALTLRLMRNEARESKARADALAAIECVSDDCTTRADKRYQGGRCGDCYEGHCDGLAAQEREDDVDDVDDMHGTAEPDYWIDDNGAPRCG